VQHVKVLLTLDVPQSDTTVVSRFIDRMVEFHWVRVENLPLTFAKVITVKPSQDKHSVIYKRIRVACIKELVRVKKDTEVVSLEYAFLLSDSPIYKDTL